ncbi:ABC transporter ATP-binding protein [Agromyces seonyuensis]|uniref:ATP-binding cassette domain-containing protein n=1 Tax=Agromyces seonyuensis TaxID=2662446 RepID=A0A6I4NX88_9MICO|nr:ABC transporter ATP-binding protein [Agromyces seonyuensis]MWB98923.1 ATP-binding cassette domain-containing protein [Agromyces seonyuensis]
MTNPPIIETHGLTKRFTVKRQEVAAVTDLSISVQPGELVAFLGPNGAGKSTSLRMLTTLIPPTAGDARVVGHDIRTEAAEVRARIGYVGQLTSGSFAQRVGDELLSQGAFYGMRRADAVRRADELVESLGLTAIRSRSVQQLSGGQKRRLDIALGLMHAPPLLFLDEPSTGLDPQSRANLWEHILRLREEHGTTVFVTTHYLEEADRYAERVLVMDQGRVIADDTAPALKSTLAGDVLTFGFGSADEASAALAVLARVTGREATLDESGRATTTVPDGDALLPVVIRALDDAGLAVRTATGVPPTLDDVFLALTGRSLREADRTADAGTGDDAEHTEPAAEAATNLQEASR